MSDKVKRGWAWPIQARKHHYFIGMDSLCRKWLYDESCGDLLDGVKDDTHPDNCAECRRKVKTFR
jgi:hypothetical protein